MDIWIYLYEYSSIYYDLYMPYAPFLKFTNPLNFFLFSLLGRRIQRDSRKKKTVFYKGKWEAILSSVLRLRDIYAGFDTLFPCLDLLRE